MTDIFGLISAVNPVERVLIIAIKVERPSAHRILRPGADVVRNIAKPVLDFLGWHPGWPLLHPSYFGDARPGKRFLAHRDAVPNRLTLRQDKVEIPIIGIGDNQLYAAYIVRVSARGHRADWPIIGGPSPTNSFCRR